MRAFFLSSFVHKRSKMLVERSDMLILCSYLVYEAISVPDGVLLRLLVCKITFMLCYGFSQCVQRNECFGDSGSFVSLRMTMTTWNGRIKHYIEDNFSYELLMKLYKRAPQIITTQAIIATLWSLYYGWFGDPMKNYYYQEWFVWANGLTPCDMCWFARVLMYPLVVLGIIERKRRDWSMYTPILILSGLWIILEYYQYWFQMSNTVTEVKSVICGVSAEVSCAATDVIYWWWLTIPLLCLLAFIVIFVTTAYAYRHHLSHHKNNH